MKVVLLLVVVLSNVIVVQQDLILLQMIIFVIQVVSSHAMNAKKINQQNAQIVIKAILMLVHLIFVQLALTAMS